MEGCCLASNVDGGVQVNQPLSDDLERLVELPGQSVSTPSTQVKGALLEVEESVHAAPAPLKRKDASSKQSST